MDKKPDLTPSQMADIIKQSGCPHIQEAVGIAEKTNIRLQDLDPTTLESVVDVIFSAEAVGAQAGRIKPKK